ncbi:MAG TPA: hypothetical protein VF507_01560, partial [Pyrinomonadaceae bacterium]
MTNELREVGLVGRREKAAAPFALLLLSLFFLSPPVRAQAVTDKMVATVNGGVRTDLITYSDLLWQMALQPDTPLQSPGPDSLKR